MGERELEDALEVERVLGPAVDDPALGWLRQRTAGCSSAASTRRVSSRRGMRWPPWTLACTQSSSVEDVVGQVQAAVGQDVALDPAQDPKRGQHRVGGRDLVALGGAGRRRSGPDRARQRGVVADGQVLIAALTRRAAHLLDAGAAV